MSAQLHRVAALVCADLDQRTGGDRVEVMAAALRSALPNMALEYIEEMEP